MLMKYKCCNCKNVFADQGVMNVSRESNDVDFSCPGCRTNLKKCSSKESNIKGINFVIATFVIGVVGNSVWGDAFHKATEMSLLVASFGLFVLSIIIVIFLNLKNKDLFIAHTEIGDGVGNRNEEK